MELSALQLSQHKGIQCATKELDILTPWRHNVEESNKNTKTSLIGTNHTADFSDVVHKASQLCYRNLQMANPQLAIGSAMWQTASILQDLTSLVAANIECIGIKLKFKHDETFMLKG